MKYLIMIVISSVALSGCATIFNGSSQKVSFSSDQDKAKVYVNGRYMGTAPLETKVDSRHSINAEFRKEGYETKNVVVTNSAGAGWIILDIVPGLLLGAIPIIVDACTGDWNSLDESNISGALEKSTTAKAE